jgi:hypothetical protein
MDTDLEIWFRGALLDLVLGAHYNLCKQQGKQVLAVDLACPPPVHDALLPQLARNASKVTGPSAGSRTYMGERISSTVWSFDKAEALQFLLGPTDSCSSWLSFRYESNGNYIGHSHVAFGRPVTIALETVPHLRVRLRARTMFTNRFGTVTNQ